VPGGGAEAFGDVVLGLAERGGQFTTASGAAGGAGVGAQAEGQSLGQPLVRQRWRAGGLADAGGEADAGAEHFPFVV
jgi:hypothetical protein